MSHISVVLGLEYHHSIMNKLWGHWYRTNIQMVIFQCIICNNHPERFQDDKPLPPLSKFYIGANHQSWLEGTQMSNRDKFYDIGLISKSSIESYRYGRSQDNWTNGDPEGEVKGIYTWINSSSGQLQMILWGPGLSYIFIKSIHSIERWRKVSWYVSPTLQVRIMGEILTHTPHQISTLLQ